jgi:hypothetical protein
MAIEIMLDVWKKAAALNGTYLLLMLALADNGNDSRECWPSVTTLGKKIRMSESQTRRCLYALRDAGYITIQDRGAAHRSNLYTIASGLEMERLGEPRGENHWKGSTDDALALVTPRGSTSDTTPLALVTPDPSLNHQEPSSSAIAESPITPAVSVAANPPARKQRTVKKQPTPSATEDSPAAAPLPPLDVQNGVRKEACRFFVEETALFVPTNGGVAGALWWTPLREICVLGGWDAFRVNPLIQKTIRKMRADRLTISSPKSLLNVAKALAAESALAARAQEPVASSGDKPWWADGGSLMGPVQGQHRGNDE